MPGLYFIDPNTLYNDSVDQRVFADISNKIKYQFPEFYREEGTNFIAFVKAYYEWLEASYYQNNTDGTMIGYLEYSQLPAADQANYTLVDNALYGSRNLFKYRDVDSTLDAFFDHFIYKYLSGFPKTLLGDKKLLEKHILDVYRSKGSVEGIKFLFRLLYNEDPGIYNPGDDVLRVSDGKWEQKKYLEVSSSSNNKNLINKQIIGSKSEATAFVDSYVVENVKIGNQSPYSYIKVHVLYLSNINGEFIKGETVYPVGEQLITITGTVANNNTTIPQVSWPTILGSVTGFKIISSAGNGNTLYTSSPLQTGGDVMVDNPYIVDPTGQFNFDPGLTPFHANGYGVKFAISNTVNRDSSNGSITFRIIGGVSKTGTKYSANPLVFVTDNTNQNGDGAKFTGVTLTDTEELIVNSDRLSSFFSHYNNTILDTWVDNIPILSYSANTSSVINTTFSYVITEVGSITGFTGVDPGIGYDGNVNVTVLEPLTYGFGTLDANSEIEGLNAKVYGELELALGVPTELRVIDSGIGYSSYEALSKVTTLYNYSYAQNNANSSYKAFPIITGELTFGGIGTKEGYWKNDDGKLDVKKYIHDNYYYQEFSYEIQISKSLDKYINVLKQVMHPTGNEVFGKVLINFVVPPTTIPIAMSITQSY